MRFSRLLLGLAFWAGSVASGQLRFCLRAEPKNLNPLMVEDLPSETIRYLTGGVLVRTNRVSQEYEPELAVSWKVTEAGKKITFRLRTGVRFSDGSPFSAEDVAYTMRLLMDPNVHATTGDTFRSSGGAVVTAVEAPDRVSVRFPAPVAGVERLFDSVSMLSSRSPLKEKAVLGPFRIADYKPGNTVLLERNPNYWKKDAAGRRLPYLDAIRLDIQQNREIELVRFQRGEIDLINDLDPEMYERLRAASPSAVRNAGPSLDSEFFWFNQVPNSPLPAYKRAWFRNREFRRAVSAAINRADLCRIVYRGLAHPAAGPVSPANLFWVNAALQPHAFDPAGALKRLEQAGFRRSGDTLRDRRGHIVEFSLITNSGNKNRERMAAMIQQDLAALGIRVNVTPLDFVSLIGRMTRTFEYEACLLGLSNVDLDPSAQMNVWLSSASNHQWNPSQKQPETPWEAEIDRLMREQASALDRRQRKAAFDRVQQIVWEEAPFIYLVHRDLLMAVSPKVKGVVPVVLPPQVYWNAERLAR